MPIATVAVPNPEHGKAGQMVAREVARANQWVCVCVPVFECVFSILKPCFPVGQWHCRPTPGLGCGTKPRPNNAGAAEGLRPGNEGRL